MEENKKVQELIKENIHNHYSTVKAVRFRDGYVQVKRESGWEGHTTIHEAYSQALLDNYYEHPDRQ